MANEPQDDWQPVATAPQDDWQPVAASAEASPAPVDAPTRQVLEPKIAPVLRAFRDGFSEGWGPESMGISDENTKKLQDLGFFRTMKDDRWNPFKAANELLLDQGTRVAETLIRGGTGLFRGGQEAVFEALGRGPFAREVAALPEAFLGTPHPLGIPKEFVKPSPIEPILHDEAPAPASVRSRVELAKTGDPVVDGVLNDPVTRDVINKAVIDREHTIPYEAGGSTPAENPTTYVDKNVPKTFTVPRVSDPTRTVTIDTGEPAAIHENVEKYVEDILVKAGMDLVTAAKVAHFDFAQMAEHGWYAANDVDPVAVEAKWKEIQPGIQRQIADDTPVDLNTRQYPNADVTKARHEELFDAPPTPEESLRGREIMQRALADNEAARAAERPPAPDLAEARDLGVIGPEERPELNSVEDVDRVMAARRAPDEKVTQEVGGKPRDTWEERWKKFTGKIDKSEDIQNIIREAATDENGNFEQARRGEINLADRDGLARAAGVDPATIDPTGVGRLLQNDRQVRLGMKMMLEAADGVKQAADALALDDSEANLVKFQEAMMRRDFTVEQIIGLRAEWGRTGQVWQEFLKQVKDQETLSEFLGKPDRQGGARTVTELRDMAEKVRNLSPQQAATFLSKTRDFPPPNSLFWLWVQGLISGPFTHIKYGIANALYAGSEYGVTPAIAAMIGAVKSVTRGETNRVFFGEPMAATWGLISAVPEAATATMRSIRDGVRAPLESEVKVYDALKTRYDGLVENNQSVPRTLLKQMEQYGRAINQVTGIGKPEWVERAGLWGRALGAPGDAAMGIHTFFKVIGERASLNAQAYRRAVLEAGENPSGSLWDRYNDFRENPTADMHIDAIADAYRGTFMQELGPRGKAWQKITKELPGLRWVFPFSHIPINLMKATYEHTPFAYLDGQMRADLMGSGVRQDKALARVIGGAAVMGYFANLAWNDLMTGEYPRDPNEQKRWKQMGIQPNSVRMGDWWVSLNKFGPVGDLAQLAANIAAAGKVATSDDDNAMFDAVHRAGAAAVNIVKDEVGMLSLAMLLEAANDPKKGARWVGNTAASFMPYSSFFGQTAAAIDPNIREVKGVLAAFQYKVPFAREGLPVKRDVLGQPTYNPAYHAILRTAPVATDPVTLEMDRLGLHPAVPQNRIGGVQLTPQLYDKYLVTRGVLTRQLVEGYMQQPSWDAMPDGPKTELIKGAFKQAGEAARAMIQVERPDLITQGVDNKIGAITGKKPVKKLPETVTP